MLLRWSRILKCVHENLHYVPTQRHSFSVKLVESYAVDYSFLQFLHRDCRHWRNLAIAKCVEEILQGSAEKIVVEGLGSFDDVDLVEELEGGESFRAYSHISAILAILESKIHLATARV